MRAEYDLSNLKGRRNPYFKDFFSEQATGYARYRPTYPEDLFRYLASLTLEHTCAWDCGAGSGQAAVGLVPYYGQVIATDPSKEQLAQAPSHPKVNFQVASAEDSGIPSNSVDLIVAGQALHWFDLPRFYAEVRRIAKPSGSIIAVWCYALAEIAPAVDAVTWRYYHDVVGKYWGPERRLVEQCYRGISFPFEEIIPPSFCMEANWNLEHLSGYFSTWSATQAAIRSLKSDPMDQIRTELQKAWVPTGSTKVVRWPLFLRVGRVFSTE